jgi:hypothetical protein
MIRIVCHQGARESERNKKLAGSKRFPTSRIDFPPIMFYLAHVTQQILYIYPDAITQCLHLIHSLLLLPPPQLLTQSRALRADDGREFFRFQFRFLLLLRM